MRWWKKRLCARVRLKRLATGNSICEGDKVNRLMKWWPPILWPKPRTSCFRDPTWSILKIGIHPTIVMATPLKSCESSHWCSMITTNVLWKSTHSIIISHSPPSHKITMSNHLGSLKSCVMTQIRMLPDVSSTSTTSSNNQATLSSWSIYHRVKLTSGLTISDST